MSIAFDFLAWQLDEEEQQMQQQKVVRRQLRDASNPLELPQSLSKSSELQDIIIKSNAGGLALDPEKVDQYMKAMSMAGSEKGTNEKLAAMWMYAAQNGTMVPTKPKMGPNARSVMLIPATGNLPHPPTMLAPPTMLPPPQATSVRSAMGGYRGMTLPYMRAAGSMPVIYAQPPHPASMPASMAGTYRTQRSTKSVDARKKRRAAQQHPQALRSGKAEANRRQRRKSDADVIDGNPSFQYTGLDRAIADNFLARQEQTHAGSHVDYSSSSGASETYGQAVRAMAPSRTSSKTKIVCRDVVM